VIPGILLMMAGVAVLGRDHPLISPVLDWLRRHREAWRKRWRAPAAGAPRASPSGTSWPAPRRSRS
jgi:hypothetical protein